MHFYNYWSMGWHKTDVVNISNSISYPFIVATYSDIKIFWWILIPYLCTMTDLHLVTPTENNKTNLRIYTPDVIVIFINVFVYLFSIVRYFWGILWTSFSFLKPMIVFVICSLKKKSKCIYFLRVFFNPQKDIHHASQFCSIFCNTLQKNLYFLYKVNFTFSYDAFFSIVLFLDGFEKHTLFEQYGTQLLS